MFTEKRSVTFENQEIVYFLERKNVKNLNLRVRRDGNVFMSAGLLVPVSETDDFIRRKGDFVLRALKKFEDYRKMSPKPKSYVSGESFYLLGKGVRLKVSENKKDKVYTDGAYIFLETKTPESFEKKERLVSRFFDDQCKKVFSEILEEEYPKLAKYGVEFPALRIRQMKTRWGSCAYKRNVITLNKRLIEAPRICIEYVVMHELCHFIHPNHSKEYYGFLTIMMPDWRERKRVLEKS